MNTKTGLTVAVLSLATALTVEAQQQNFDITVHDGNRLRPGATHKEIRDWMKSQVIESTFHSALQGTLPNAPQLPPQIIQMIKYANIRSRTLDEVVAKYQTLKPEADALYVQIDAQSSQEVARSRDAAQLPAALVQAIKLADVRCKILDRLILAHPDLKPQADAWYVQYDGIITQEMMKAQQTGR